MVVLEIATGTWCQWCPSAARGAEDLLSNGKYVAVVENHNGDAYANVFSNSRNSYYNVTGYPTAKFDGIITSSGGNTGSMYNKYLIKYNSRINILSYIQLDAVITNQGINYSAIITASRIGTTSITNTKLHLFITESNIPCNWFGQSYVHHVNRLMVPDKNGTFIDFSTNNIQTVTLNWIMDAQWNIENCEFVIMIQDATTSKEIFNGMKRGAIDLSVNFTASDTVTYKNNPILFTNNTFGGYIGEVPITYEWIFEGGTPSTSIEKNPTIIYNEFGLHSVTLIVNKGGQIDTLTKNNYIKIDPPVGYDNKNNKAIIFQNPNNGKFTIEKSGLFNIKIYNTAGLILYEKNNCIASEIINLNENPGLYFICIEDRYNNKIEKLIIN